MQCCCASFLRANDDKRRQAVAGFSGRPNEFVAWVFARILGRRFKAS